MSLACKLLSVIALVPFVVYAQWLPTAPKHYSVQLFARIDDARSLAIGPNGQIFVSTRRAGKVWALHDDDKDGYAERKQLVAENLDMPNGIAVCGTSLYVVTNQSILRFPIQAPFQGTRIYHGLPAKRHHGWRYAVCDGQQSLIISIGVPCNICQVDEEQFGILTRFHLATRQFEVLAAGIRNAVGMAWDPKRQFLWFTDNGRDWLGDDLPPDELNRLPMQKSELSGGVPHYGFPYLHGRSTIDPIFGKQRPKDLTIHPPVWEFAAHVAPLGLTFVHDKDWRSEVGDLLIAQHGSWNRSQKIGYRVVALRLNGDAVIGQTMFLDGFLDTSGQVRGRPVDVVFLKNGTLLVSDDANGAIYSVMRQSR